MGITYFKRYRMQYDMSVDLFDRPGVPSGYHLFAWSEDLLASHADVKYRSFRNEIDSTVFPCLGDHEGCYRLMVEISNRNGFVPASTWLVGFQDDASQRMEYCGTIQGIIDIQGRGSIQNLGIVPEHRNAGLGSLLMFHALKGFYESGVPSVTLEVTAQNLGALRLYNRLGFKTIRTVYKASDVAFAN